MKRFLLIFYTNNAFKSSSTILTKEPNIFFWLRLNLIPFVSNLNNMDFDMAWLFEGTTESECFVPCLETKVILTGAF